MQFLEVTTGLIKFFLKIVLCQEKIEIHLQKQLHPRSPNPGFSWYGNQASTLAGLGLIDFCTVSPEHVKIASPAHGKGFLPPDPPANLSCPSLAPSGATFLQLWRRKHGKAHLSGVHCLQSPPWSQSPVAGE